MTNKVTPIKKQRVKIDTCGNYSRFFFADFTGGEHDDLHLIDSLGYTLRRVAGLLDVIADASVDLYSLRSGDSRVSERSENISPILR